MKTNQLFERLWEHGRTLRRVGLVLVMCIMAIPELWAWATNVYLNGNFTGDNWSGSSAYSSTYQFKLQYNSTDGKFYIPVYATGSAQYFRLWTNNHCGPATNNKEIDAGDDGCAASSYDEHNWKYVGDAGIISICIDQTGGKDWNPWVWVERPDIYIRHKWNNSSLSNQKMTDNRDGTYHYIGKFSSSAKTTYIGPCSSCESDNVYFKKWTSPTMVGSPTNGDRCIFEYNASGYKGVGSSTSNMGTITITKLYSITYDGNGKNSGTVPTGVTDKKWNETTTIADNTGTLAKTGYVFAGWNTAADGTGTYYAPGSTFTPSAASTTLYAQWLTVHTPGLYETAAGSGGYGQSLVESDDLQYEVYQYAISSSKVYVYAGTSTTSTSAANYMLHYATSGGNALRNWMLHSGGIYGNSDNSTHTKEFQQNAKQLNINDSYKHVIAVSGFDQFSIYAKDKTVSSQQVEIYINGSKVTAGSSTSLTVRRYNLTPETTYIIRIEAIGSGSNASNDLGFSLRVPSVVCGATQPGTISKGTLSACSLPLTAAGSAASNNTWYWQESSTGTDKTGTSGATKNVTSTGTYYVRSYYSTGNCWSDAESYTVTASDLTPAAPSALAKSSVTAKGVTLTVTDAANTNDYEFYVNTSSSAPSASTPASYTSTSKSVTITDKYAGTTFYAWARAKCGSNKSAWTALTGSTFTTSTVSAAYHLTNVSKTSGAESGIGGSTFTAVFSANTDYSMPTPVVTIGGNAATSGTDYTWTEGTGTLTIAKEKITGNIDITLNSADAAPSSAVISGTYHYFPGDNISLTCTPTGNNGPTTYQWYKGGKADGNAIDGATSATFTKNICAFEDAGSYYCKVTCNATSIWANTNSSENYDVKILRLYVNGSRNGEAYGNVDFVKVDETTATASIALGAGWTYGFSVADGCGTPRGNTGTMTEDNCTGWTMNSTSGQCAITTTNAATYIFTVNYSDLSAPVVSVTYPVGNQAEGKVIYFDNNVLKWTGSSIYYRIGHSSHSQASQLSLVSGTANLYKMTTTEYNGFSGWHIANATGDVGSGKSIYKTVDGTPITEATAHEGGAVTQEAITVTPTTSKGYGADKGVNDNCEFYNYTITSGMKTQNVAISPYSNGTITVNYTNTSGSAATLTSGNADLAHSVILTSITATPNTGYDASAITINGGAYSANYVVTGNTTIAATFSPHVYTITLDKGDHGAANQSATVAYLAGELTSIAHVTSTGYTLTGYYDGETKVLNANGTFAGANVTGYITDSKWTRTSDATLTAKWTAKTTTITIDANTGNHGSSTPGNVTATFGSALPSFTAAAGVSGWNLTGYFTEATSGTKVINADGTLVASTDYADGSAHWKYESATLTLYAQYEEAEAGCVDANSTNFGEGNSSGDASKTLDDGTVVAMYKCTNSASSVSIGGNILFTAPTGKAFETFSFVATCGSDSKTNYYKINGGSQQNLESSTTTSKRYTITVPASPNTTTIQIIKHGTTPAVTEFCYTYKDVCTTPATAFANGAYTVGGSALDLSTLISGKQGSGAITYTVKNANGTGAAIAGTSFTATSAGTATVTATQAADATYCEKVMDATITVSAGGGYPAGYIYITDVKATPETGASGVTATGGSYDNSLDGSFSHDGYTKWFQTSGASGYYQLNFSPALDVSTYTDLKVDLWWGVNVGSNRATTVYVNGTSVGTMQVDSKTRYQVLELSDLAVTATSISSIKIEGGGGGANSVFFRVGVKGTPATPCTVVPTVSATTTGATTSTTQVVNCSGISSLGTGTCTITSYGFVYGTSANPTLSDSHVDVGTSYTVTGTAFAETTLTGLTPSTTYYVRAYATNGAGTGYGDDVSFTTSAVPAGAPVITDQPTLSEVALGETASFSLTATGATSYQWYNCDSEGENKTEASGASAATASYSYTTTVTGTTYYICKVSNASGDTWSDVVGSIVTPATFTVKYTAGADDGKTYDLAGGANDFTQGHEAVSEVADKFSNWSNYTFTGVGISGSAKKSTMSMLISMPTAYDANKYVSFHFDLAANYQLQLTNVNLQVQAKDNVGQSFKFVISDEYGHSYTKEVASLGQTGKLVQIGGDISETTKFVGTITLKLYGWYSSTDYYRLAKEVTITGEVSSLPAPTASWTARPASATVGDGGKTYTLTTDGTNTVAWSITDQSDATGAALSPTSGLTTTLGGYTTAGSLYVQASVTGDGIHYLSTPATLLRQRVVISGDCSETTLISATLSSCTGTGDVTGTPSGTSAVAFESCESLDGGYKMGKDGSYMRLALTSGNFAANDEVKITITKASDLGDGALHIYKYASSEWTELGSVVAAGAGTYSYTLTETNVSTAFNTIGLYRTGKNQNPYVKALSVVRNSCSESKPHSVSVTASPTGPYAIGATPTLTVTATNADTYQWYSNTNNTASDGFLLVGETETTYSPSTAIAGTTYYYCVATNASGSTVSNIITVTVNSAKTTPVVSWTGTDEEPNYGGGGYTVTATVSTGAWDGTLTTDMLTASDGVTLTGVSVSGKVITATYGVTETARSPLSFSLTLPETTNYTALAANKEITFDRCGEGAVIATTEHPLPVKSSYTYTTSTKPNYSWITDGVGWLTLVAGSSSISSTSDSYSGFSYRSNSGKPSITFYSELDAVTAVRVYIKGGGSTTLSKVQKGTTLGKYTQLAPSTDYDYSYSNGSSSIESREQGYIEITFKTALSANTFVEITLSRNTEYYGVGLITGNSEVGNITTALTWATDPGTTVNKYTTDANFRYEAVKASDADSRATLGTISYKSSVPAVATVSATGVVDVLSEGTTTITATLAGSGCYKKATLSYNLVVAEATCTDEAGTIAASGSGITIDGNTVTKADACANVTLTVSGHTGEDAGATYQWYKDGVSMGASYQTKSITVTANGDYTVEVTNTGGVHCTMPATNTITITGNAISITKIVDEWYVKNGRRTPDIALATIEGTTDWSVKEGETDITSTGFGGCMFYMQDGVVYLKGQTEAGAEPSGLTAGDATLTITAVSACGDDPTATITIHKQVSTAKPSIAFIVDGTKGDPVNNVATAKTISRPIWIYLSESFDLTGCNAYWTNNEKLIRQYYSQFDAIVITDDPSTDEKPKSGLKYVNALGTMVDVRPILTMEAYVGKYGASSNWHIGGTPSSPNPRQYELKLQCKDHDIYADLTPGANFRSEEIGGETYYYVTMVDNSVTPYAGLADDAETETYPALQGFSAASIKGTGLLGIGTISDGTLQGGVERQDEPTARMMILGIQHQAMAALTSEGKQIIKNAIEYLLMTNMEDVNDCASYFIGTTDNDWSNPSNWSSNKLPDASTKARILAPVTVSTKAHVAQLDIAVRGRSSHYNNGGTECSGRVTINPTGALIVEGQVRRTTNGRLFTEDELQPTTPADLTIQTSPSAQGALILDNSDGETQATVQMYSPSYWEVMEGTNKKKSYWSYVGVPIQDVPVGEYFYGAVTYLYDETSGWIRKRIGSEFHAFEGIGLSLPEGHRETFYGTLASTETKEITLTKTTGVGEGDNLIGNSWTAPIQIGNFDASDFGSATAVVSMYKTGRDDIEDNPTVVTATAENDGAVEAGQWVSIPIGLPGTDGYDGPTVIPSMQAFQVTTSSETTLTLDYDKLVRDVTIATDNLTQPMSAPKRKMKHTAKKSLDAMMRVRMSGFKTRADLWIMEDGRFSDEYDNGWEANYIECDNRSPQLYANSEIGKMAFLAKPDIEGTTLGIAPSRDGNEYLFTFHYVGDEEFYLNDLKLKQSVLISEEESYSFMYEDGDTNRFYISRTPIEAPQTPTGVDNTRSGEVKAQKFIYNDKMYIMINGRVYSAEGQIVK